MFVVFCFTLARSTHAQQPQPDLCKVPLTVQSGISEVQMFRLRCTIQTLLNDRNEQVNRAIQAEVERDAIQSKLASAEDELAATRKKLGETEKRLKATQAGLATIAEKLKNSNSGLLGWMKDQLKLLGAGA